MPATARVIVSVPPPAPGLTTPKSLPRRVLGVMGTVASLRGVRDVDVLQFGLEAVGAELAEILREMRAGEGA